MSKDKTTLLTEIKISYQDMYDTCWKSYVYVAELPGGKITMAKTKFDIIDKLNLIFPHANFTLSDFEKMEY